MSRSLFARLFAALILHGASSAENSPLARSRRRTCKHRTQRLPRRQVITGNLYGLTLPAAYIRPELLHHRIRAILRRYRRDERLNKIAPQLTEPQRSRILSGTSKHRGQRLPRGGSLLFADLDAGLAAKAARRNAERAA